MNLGPCISGCAQGGKSSTDITYWPEAIRRGVELRTRCRVREITVNEHGLANGVVYYNAAGEECFQRAEVVVMACNGVGTPRILLNSKSAQFPDGLANSSGLVGKNLMFHPMAFVQGLFDERLDSHKGPQACCILSKQFYETDLSRGFVRGYNMQIVARIRAARHRDGRLRERHDSVGSRPSRGVPPTVRPRRVDRHPLRGPARGTQHRHARPDARRFERHPGAEDHVPLQRQQPEDDGTRPGTRRGSIARGRRAGSNEFRTAADIRLASARHRAHAGNDPSDPSSTAGDAATT